MRKRRGEKLFLTPRTISASRTSRAMAVGWSFRPCTDDSATHPVGRTFCQSKPVGGDHGASVRQHLDAGKCRLVGGQDSPLEAVPGVHKASSVFFLEKDLSALCSNLERLNRLTGVFEHIFSVGSPG